MSAHPRWHGSAERYGSCTGRETRGSPLGSQCSGKHMSYEDRDIWTRRNPGQQLATAHQE